MVTPSAGEVITRHKKENHQYNSIMNVLEFFINISRKDAKFENAVDMNVIFVNV
jgi:hypothetical protein